MKNSTVINCGGIESSLENFGPFFCLVRSGSMSADVHCKENNKDGIFAFSNSSKGGSLYQTGLIFPISFMDTSLKTKLEKMISWIKALPINNDIKLSRKMLQSYIKENNLDFLKISSDSELNGWIELKLDKNIFDNFVQDLSYISEVGIENHNTTIRETKKFRWKSYGELMEWFYDLPQPKRNIFHKVELFSFYLVTNYADGAGYATLQKSVSLTPSYELPKVDLTTLFELKKEIKNSSLEAFIEKTQSGWSLLRLSIDKEEYHIVFSNAFDPLEALVSFLCAVDRNDFPVMLTVDEEGTDKRIEGYALSESERFLFVLSDPYDDEYNGPIVQAVFDRKYFIEVVIKAFKDFFEHRYIQSEWDWYLEEGEPSVKEKILNDIWFCSR